MAGRIERRAGKIVETRGSTSAPRSEGNRQLYGGTHFGFENREVREEWSQLSRLIVGEVRDQLDLLPAMQGKQREAESIRNDRGGKRACGICCRVKKERVFEDEDWRTRVAC